MSRGLIAKRRGAASRALSKTKDRLFLFCETIFSISKKKFFFITVFLLFQYFFFQIPYIYFISIVVQAERPFGVEPGIYDI